MGSGSRSRRQLTCAYSLRLFVRDIGGFVFFPIAVIGTGAIFTLLTIKDLLEEQVRLLRRSN